MAKGLGRLYIPDERDLSFPMQAAIPREAPERNHRYWWTSGAWHGDQGNFPECVGYAWTHFLSVGPITHKAKPPYDPRHLYREAQKVDQWPGENYAGTSVRAGAKVLQAAGLIESYLWAYDADTVTDALFTKGPVVLGTWWYEGMSKPEKGTNIIRATGARQGGHAYIIPGGTKKRGMYKVMNSWGKGYGFNGFAWLPMEEVDKLLKDQGEACLAIERRV